MPLVLVETQICRTPVSAESLAIFRKTFGAEVKVGDIFLAARIMGLPGEPEGEGGLFIGPFGPYDDRPEELEKGQALLQDRVRSVMALAGLLYGGRLPVELSPEQGKAIRRLYSVGDIVEDSPESPPPGTPIH